MKNIFIHTANVSRFISAARALADRGAPEASLMLVFGGAGLGKSRAGQWWGIQNDAARVRLKAAATPHWFLSDLVRELGEAPAHTCEKLFGQAVLSLAREPRPLVVDEVENGLARDLAVIETVRDIADLTEIPVVLVGREYVAGKMKRYRQIWTRISALAEFGPATLDDVALACRELAEVEIAEDLVEAIARQSEGHIREIVKAIKNVERVGLRRKGEKVTLANVVGEPLTHDWRRTRRAA